MVAAISPPGVGILPPAPTNEFSPTLFYDFIAWIDRSEKTARSYLTNLKQFMAWLKFAAVKNPSRQDVIAYRQWVSAEHEAISLSPDSDGGWKYRLDKTGSPLKVMCKPNTVALYVRSVCQFFRWTAANGLYPDVAANIHPPKIKYNVHRKEALTVAEVMTIEQSLKNHCEKRKQAAQEVPKDTTGRIQRATEQGKRLYAMYLLAVNAGLRTIEISRANIKDLVTKGNQAWLYIWGKGHTEPDQRKPIAPEVATAIADYLQSRTDNPTTASPLFVSTGNRSGGKRIATTTISTMLKRAMQEAGFNSERLTAHSLRHTTGTAVQGLTGDIYTTQKYMRHLSPATTEIYLHNDTEQAEIGVAKRLYALFHGHDNENPRETLLQIIDGLNQTQLEKLTKIAAAMA